MIGLILLVVLAVGSFLAFNKKLPWSHGYTVKAVFTTAMNVRVKSPVRIAGVNVGEVTGIQHLTSSDPAYSSLVSTSSQGKAPSGRAASVVTMQINDLGRPIKTDATFRLRPRLFLEGNLFVDVHPGSPSAPEAPDGYVFPVTQTSTSVQLDQILTTLQYPVRKDLQVFLHNFGDALIKYGGATGFQQFFRTSPGAFKYSSQVNEALLGTRPNDLSGLVKNLDTTVRALDQNQTALQDLVTNLKTVTGSFAAHDQALQKAVKILPQVLAVGRPALATLDSAVDVNPPSPLNQFAQVVLPGVRSTPAALDAAIPFLKQVKGLVSKPELRGLVHKLRPAVPKLTQLEQSSVPFLNQSRALSSCFNQVIIPWANSTVPDNFFPATGKVYEETGYGLSGISGESRSGDANGQYIRVGTGGGVNTLTPLNTGFIVKSNPASSTVPFFGFLSSQIIGELPSIDSSAKTPFRPDAPCERQQPPNLDAGSVGTPPPQQKVSTLGALPASIQQLSNKAKSYVMNMGRAALERSQGKVSTSNQLIKKTSAGWQQFLKGPWQSLLSQIQALGNK